MDDIEIPSPPPFYRVCGHFTMLNPSRPMALSKLFATATISESFDMVQFLELEPDLITGEDQVSVEGGDSITCEWPRLESIRNKETTKTVGDDSQNASIDANVTTGIRRFVQTPHGLAILLDTPTQNTTSTNVEGERRHSRWSTEEDEILRAAAEIEGPPPYNWMRISNKYFQGSRNAMACKGRWNKHLRPGLALENWTPAEDAIIIQGHAKGMSWPEIAERLPDGRLPENIRNRFLNDIDPSLNKAPFTEEERRKVFELQALHGNKWTQIASEMPGRSETMVKNCWFNAKISHRRKRQRLSKKP